MKPFTNRNSIKILALNLILILGLAASGFARANSLELETVDSSYLEFIQSGVVGVDEIREFAAQGYLVEVEAFDREDVQVKVYLKNRYTGEVLERITDPQTAAELG